jgi:hypothetical protein
MRRRCGNGHHEAQRKRREAPDQTQCQISAFDATPQRKVKQKAAPEKGLRRGEQVP